MGTVTSVIHLSSCVFATNVPGLCEEDEKTNVFFNQLKGLN